MSGQARLAGEGAGRPLGVAERAMCLLEDGGGVGHLVRVVEIAGEVTADGLTAAWKRLVRRHPLLGATVVGEAGAAPRFAEAQRDPEIRCRESSEPLAEAGALAEAELEERCWPSGAALIRFHLVRGVSGGPSALVVSCHHAIADGRSLNRLLRDLVRVCAGATGHATTPPDRGAVPPPAEEVAFAGRSRRQIETALDSFVAREAKLATAGTVAALPLHQAGTARSILLHASLPVEAARALRVYRARTRRPVHAMLVAATARAIAATWFPGERDLLLPVVSTVDLRGALEFAAYRDELALYMSGVRTLVPVRTDSDLADSATELAPLLQGEELRRRAALGVLLQSHAVEYHMKSGAPPGVATVTNLGNAELAHRHERPRVVALHGGVPMHAFGATLYNHVVAHDDRVVWNTVFPDPWVARPDAERFLERVIGDVAELLGVTPDAMAAMAV